MLQNHHADGQWWLEGFRVDPKYQGLKVGSLIHHYLDHWWLEHGSGVLRLMMTSSNESVHHLCESTGYTKFSRCAATKRSLPGRVDAFTPAVSNDEDLDKVVEFALKPIPGNHKSRGGFWLAVCRPHSERRPPSLFIMSSSFKIRFSGGAQAEAC